MTERFIGLMSGTSLDGVDAVLARFAEDGRLDVEAEHCTPYPQDMRDEVLSLQAVGHDELGREALLANRLALLYADAVRGLLLKAGKSEGDIIAVACHGQTIRHAPHQGYTLQSVNLALLAERCGIDVMGDFRARDVAAGGQGAPLVPAFHQSVFADATENRVILNIGGISNLTRLAAGQPVIGFDCGPGNMLMDAWCHQHIGRRYDVNGEWAASGQLHAGLLRDMLAEDFFLQPPPKSTGRDLFDLPWLVGKLARHGDVPPADVQRSLLALTARSIVDAIHGACPDTRSVYVCGGGALNGALMAELAAMAPDMRWASTAELGLPVHQVEAAAFAWLGWRFHHRQPANLPEVTGASGLRVLGALYPY